MLPSSNRPGVACSLDTYLHTEHTLELPLVEASAEQEGRKGSCKASSMMRLKTSLLLPAAWAVQAPAFCAAGRRALCRYAAIREACLIKRTPVSHMGGTAHLLLLVPAVLDHHGPAG